MPVGVKSSLCLVWKRSVLLRISRIDGGCTGVAMENIASWGGTRVPSSDTRFWPWRNLRRPWNFRAWWTHKFTQKKRSRNWCPAASITIWIIGQFIFIKVLEFGGSVLPGNQRSCRAGSGNDSRSFSPGRKSFLEGRSEGRRPWHCWYLQRSAHL